MPPKANGFMAFVTEWRKSNVERSKLSVQKAVKCCGEIWTKMDAQQREPYNAVAKARQRSNQERLDSIGKSVSEGRKEMLDAHGKQMEIKRNIERIVLQSKTEHDLENAEFIFVAFNYFTKVMTADICIPAEFAACRYSIKSGIKSIYSTHINPGYIILGHASDAMDHSSTSHRLPLPPDALGESDMRKLYGNILEYLQGGCQSDGQHGAPLIVYTITSLMPVVNSCFRYLASDGKEDAAQIEVYDLQYLFYVLKKEVMELAGQPQDHINHFITDRMFNKSFFDYQMGISCEFHEDNDRTLYCTQSMVTRWSFIISYYLCSELSIKMLPGKHFPLQQTQMLPVTNSGIVETSTLPCTPVKQELQSDYVSTDDTVSPTNIDAAEVFP